MGWAWHGWTTVRAIGFGSIFAAGGVCASYADWRLQFGAFVVALAASGLYDYATKRRDAL